MVTEASDTGLRISAKKVMDDLKVSDSICVNGTCLTVTRIEGDDVHGRYGSRDFAPDEPG